MEFREIYRGVTVNVRYDPNTFTFIGEVSGLDHPVSVQAATYEDLQDTCVKAIDDALLAGTKSIGDYADELHRAQETAEEVVRAAITARTGVRVETTPIRADDDPFSRRRFLR